MSHFTRLKTRLKNEDRILEALRDLGFACQTGSFTLKTRLGERATVSILVYLPSGGQIGLREEGGTYEIIADWAEIAGLNEQDFHDRLLQRYAYRTTLAELSQQGFELSEEQHQKGAIHLVLRRMR